MRCVRNSCLPCLCAGAWSLPGGPCTHVVSCLWVWCVAVVAYLFLTAPYYPLGTMCNTRAGLHVPLRGEPTLFVVSGVPPVRTACQLPTESHDCSNGEL